jgi:hypothetical protein
MTRPAADRVKVVWNGTGTGTMTLSGAVPGEPVQAVPAALDGQVVRYVIVHQSATEAEAGYGTYTHSNTSLTRTYRTYPALGGSAVTFSAGTKHVSITPSHVDIVPNITTANPGVNDDISTGYLIGHYWVNTTNDTVWMCVDHTDGAAVWVQIDPSGASIVIAQNEIGGRVAAGSGPLTGLGVAEITEDETPASGDMLLGWSGSALRIFDIGNLPSVGDSAPTKVISNAATFPLADAARLHNNVRVVSHQTNVVFEVPQAASAESEWRIEPLHTGCTVAINGGVGTIAPNPARLILGGLAIVTVTANSGSSPTVLVRADVIVPPAAVTTKTYAVDDHGQDFAATGTQTFGAQENFPTGFYVNIWNNTAGDLTVDGVTTDHVIPARGVVTVRKLAAALVCNGSGGDTLLDS